MTRRLMACGVLCVSLCLGARAGDSPVKTAPAHAAFEKLKALAGTWVEADKDGKPTDKVVSVIRVTAGGSAVHETIFPGQQNEMISIYHLNQGELLLTHYCLLGNQPRMKADPKSPANQIHFRFDGGTNFDPAKDTHMHEATLTFIDADHVDLSGVAWVNGKPSADHCGTMKLVRKK